MENTCPAPQGPSLAKRLTCLGIALIIILAGWLLPAPDGLSFEGKMALSLMVAGIFLWVTEPVPVAVSGLVIMVSLPAFGILPFLNATDPATGATTIGVWGGFISNVIFFILASFGITAALLKTKIPAKIVFALLQLTRGNSRATIGAFMVAAAILSFLISDLPCTALFTGIAVSSILKVQGCACGSSNLGKALMIGITYASVVGGQAIPSGSAMNVMAMNVLTAHTGISISFLGWTSICLPIALVLIVFCWISVVLVFKPEPIADSCLQGIRDEAAGAKKIEAHEIKAIIVVVGLLVLWIPGNWIPVLNATVVALIGLTVMFLPGMELLTWKEFQNSVPWGIVIMCGTIMSMGGVIEATGGAAFLAGAIAGSDIMNLGFFAAFALMLALIYLLHTVCPIGVAILGVFLPIMIPLCAGFGVSPAVPTIALAVVVAGNYLMPVNPTVMLTYGEGYYTFTDMLKTGIVPAIALVLLMALWMPFIVGVMGI